MNLYYQFLLKNLKTADMLYFNTSTKKISEQNIDEPDD